MAKDGDSIGPPRDLVREGELWWQQHVEAPFLEEVRQQDTERPFQEEVHHQRGPMDALWRDLQDLQEGARDLQDLLAQLVLNMAAGSRPGEEPLDETEIRLIEASQLQINQTCPRDRSLLRGAILNMSDAKVQQFGGYRALGAALQQEMDTIEDLVISLGLVEADLVKIRWRWPPNQDMHEMATEDKPDGTATITEVHSPTVGFR